jgi:hypothetical protein
MNDSLFAGDFAIRAVEQSVDGILVIDAFGCIRFANAAAMTLFAGRTSVLIGFQLGTPAMDSAVEMILPGAGGSTYVEMRSVTIDWQGRPASLASLRDITGRKRAEEMLVEQAEHLRQRNAELMRFNQAAAGRELRMIELKEEVNELCQTLGMPPRYRIPREP